MKSRTSHQKEAVKESKNAYLLSTSTHVLPSVISPFLSIEDRVNTFTMCSNLYTTFKPNLESLAFTRLLQATVDDERTIVKNILDQRPALVLKVEPQVIESKKTWQRFLIENPFQIATQRRQLEMIKLLLPYFKVKSEALALWKDRKANKQEIALYHHKIKQLIQVIAAETFAGATYAAIAEMINSCDFNDVKLNEDTKKIVEDLRKDLLPDKAITLENGNYFDLEQFLIAAHYVYDTCFDVLQGTHQRSFFSICIIGLLQSVLPPGHAKRLCQGLNDAVNHKKSLDEPAESLHFTSGTAFYRESRNFDWGLGLNFFTTSIGSHSLEVSSHSFDRNDSMKHDFEKLCRENTEKIIQIENELKSGQKLGVTIKLRGITEKTGSTRCY